MEQILPRARSDEEAGIGFLPDGQTLYRQAIRGFTTLELDPETVHLTGLHEVDRNDAELAELACSELGTTDLLTALDRLRSGTGLGFDSREEMLAAARAAVARAEERCRNGSGSGRGRSSNCSTFGAEPDSSWAADSTSAGSTTPCSATGPCR